MVVMNRKVVEWNDVKCVGAYIDGKLAWSFHINKLSLQLAEHTAMLHHIQYLKLLHCSFAYNRVNYGIIV